MMTYKEITDLIKLVNKTELSEIKLKQDDFEISIRTKYHQSGKSVQTTAPVMTMPGAMPMAQPAAAPVAAAPIAQPAVKEEKNEDAPAANLLEVKSPIVGTFYRSPSPDKPPFVKVGDTIESGSVVCIVEAMKLFNEIESEVSGKIVKVLVEDAQPVEYDQPLFLVEPA